MANAEKKIWPPRDMCKTGEKGSVGKNHMLQDVYVHIQAINLIFLPAVPSNDQCANVSKGICSHESWRVYHENASLAVHAVTVDNIQSE